MGRPGRPEEIATVASFLLSAEAAFITGETLTVDGGAANVINLSLAGDFVKTLTK